MNKCVFVAYELFNKQLHGGEDGDIPEGHCLMLCRVSSLRDICFFVIVQKKIGLAYVYKWISPVTKSEYTLCVPKGIVVIQHRFRRRLAGRLSHYLYQRQIQGLPLLRLASRRRRPAR